MIKVFSQDSCPNCDTLKNILKQNSIDFEEVNINNDFTAKAQLIINDIDSTPAVSINGKIISGDVDYLQNAIKEVTIQ